ncbi:MAG: YqaJ viral recombinase family protein [Gammaproteobacteria bacterium]|nr:YqaJ viral recombinase family protein [Gammaproteobacteria bacterium]
MEQDSEDWHNIRKGRATASEFDKIITATGRQSKQAHAYMRKLARESYLSDPHRFRGNKYTEWGREHEVHARNMFRHLKDLAVVEVGFVISDKLQVVGCSPDGLVCSDDGEYIAGLEIKCPQPDTHVDYLLEGLLPDKYKLQVHGSMAVTGLDSWWFVSYFPGMNPLIIEVKRDDFTDLVERRLEQFVLDFEPTLLRVYDAMVPKETMDII